MSAARIPVIGIVGGIGSGKSALANALNEYFQCGRLDADAAGHRALARPEVKASLRTAFGESIFDTQGEILRPQLAAIVFGVKEQQQAARAKLEAIVHPIIRKEVVDQLELHQIRMDCDIILLDAALLIEAGWSNDCDAVIFVDVPDQIRRKRVQQRGWSADELARREASQLSLAEKKERADLVVDNSRDIQSAAAQAAIWLKERFQLNKSVETAQITR